MKALLLTFDTEEFDLPTEYGLTQTKEDQLRTNTEGTKRVLALLKRHNISATFFVTAYFAHNNKKLVEGMAKDHEIAVHGALHSDNYRKMSPKEAEARIKKAREDVEKITKKNVYGFRAPRFQTPPIACIKNAGYTYDSSLHPTYIPGRYNNFFKPRIPFRKNDLFIFPISVSPFLRMPFSWIWFRNLPLLYTKIHSRMALMSTGFLHLYFHPWEFVSLEKWKGKLPRSIMKNTGKIMEKKLDEYILWCKEKGCRTMTVNEYIKMMRF